MRGRAWSYTATLTCWGLSGGRTRSQPPGGTSPRSRAQGPGGVFVNEEVVRAGLAHLWFVTIHPFDDGNGRVARAIADNALAQSEGSAQRFYSMSSQIREERSDYYDTLERTQKGDPDVTDWLVWFLRCFARAIDGAEAACANVLRKADFWQRYARVPFSERQKTVLHRYLDGFEGKLTAKKWAAIGQSSVPTAQRDINDLLERGVLRRNPGGSKNTSYDLVMP
jgi:Fic family protein